jgi:four helix bundle protein
MDNIAEGFGRGGNKEFIQFLGYARGSNNETKAQLQRIFDRKYISESLFVELYCKSETINEQLSKFMGYLKLSDRRGSKFDN